jgi:hypothetical protein
MDFKDRRLWYGVVAVIVVLLVIAIVFELTD